MSELKNRPHDPDDGIEALFRLAKRPQDPAAEISERVRETVHETWLRTLKARRRRRWAFSTSMVAAAATLVWLAGPLTTSTESMETVPALAHLARLNGTEIWVNEALVLDEATPFFSGDVLRTGPDSRMSIEFPGGTSLRLDRASQLTLVSPNECTLSSGAVYIDGRPKSTPITVMSQKLAVTEIGTQFEVRLLPAATRVRVREGAVQIDRSTQNLQILAGQEMSANQNGDVQQRQISPYDTEWDWVTSVAKLPELRELTVYEFLLWYAREKGQELRFDDSALREELKEATIEGTIPSLDAYQTRDAVLAIASLALTSDDEYLVISRMDGKTI